MEKICGIYKITSPKNRVYIGQSINVLRRFSRYKKLACKQQPKLYNSFKKYGVGKHKFEVLHQCEPKQLNELECYYIELFQCFDNEYGLNLKSGGSNGVHSEETKQKISEAAKSRKHTSETRRKISESLKEITRENHPRFGKKHSEEAKRKIGESLKSTNGEKRITKKAFIINGLVG